MTQEDKEILLKDLCARLPYHPFAYGKSGYACNEGRLILVTSSGCAIMTGGGSHVHYFFNEIKLYLRPMSSMTEDEKKELGNFVAASMFASQNKNPLFKLTREALIGDFFNKHHFDYRGLITKGLALEAPKDMYKI